MNCVLCVVDPAQVTRSVDHLIYSVINIKKTQLHSSHYSVKFLFEMLADC